MLAPNDKLRELGNNELSRKGEKPGVRCPRRLFSPILITSGQQAQLELIVWLSFWQLPGIGNDSTIRHNRMALLFGEGVKRNLPMVDLQLNACRPKNISFPYGQKDRFRSMRLLTSIYLILYLKFSRTPSISINYGHFVKTKPKAELMDQEHFFRFDNAKLAS